jgi:hypothetical protein
VVAVAVAVVCWRWRCFCRRSETSVAAGQLYLGPSAIQGVGLFCKEAVAAGAIILPLAIEAASRGNGDRQLSIYEFASHVNHCWCVRACIACVHYVVVCGAVAGWLAICACNSLLRRSVYMCVLVMTYRVLIMYNHDRIIQGWEYLPALSDC